MSETAPEPAAGSGGGNPLRARLGPLPAWAWALIVTGLAVGYYLVAKRKSANSQAAADSTTMSGAAGIPDYVSQTTVNITEPPDQPQTVTGFIPHEPGPVPTGKHPGPGPRPPVKKPGGTGQPPLMSGSYTVRPGDTLEKIAARFGISRVDLAHANGLGTGAGLRTGQVLKVPGPLKTRAEGGPG